LLLYQRRLYRRLLPVVLLPVADLQRKNRADCRNGHRPPERYALEAEAGIPEGLSKLVFVVGHGVIHGGCGVSILTPNLHGVKHAVAAAEKKPPEGGGMIVLSLLHGCAHVDQILCVGAAACETALVERNGVTRDDNHARDNGVEAVGGAVNAAGELAEQAK